MELTNLKRKLATARRGHKLLKDKRDELMRRFMEMVRENKALRKSVEEKIVPANAHMALARSVMGDAELEAALMIPMQETEIGVTEKNVMSVLIPQYRTEFRTEDSADIFPYSFASTSTDLDGAVEALSDILPDLMKLAEIEKSCQLMAAEIEKTRRRVNALEHVMIPQYEETIKFISMKLEENERGATTRIMKVKDMMLKQAHQY
jgi:V/A-type H+-transporting ATPase subunit D